MLFKEALERQFLIFDGAMGTMIQKAGLKAGELPESYNITHPEVIQRIHESYVRAGADIVTTNTFQANDLKLRHGSFTLEQIIPAGVELAKKSGAQFVALDIGPLGQLIEPIGKLRFEEAYNLFAKQVRVGTEAGADLILLETFTDLYEAKAAVLAAKENSSLPVICTMTFQRNQKTLLGTDPVTAALVLQGLGVDALGVNCSLGPKELMPIVEEILKYSVVPVIVQPNAGLPKFDGQDTYYDLTPEAFAGYIKEMLLKGVTILGGCCGTTPEYIMVVKNVITGLAQPKRIKQDLQSACSDRKSIIFQGQPLSIGEINLKRESLCEELFVGYVRTIVGEAKKQQKSGVDLIKLNIEAVEPNNLRLLKELIKRFQKNIHVPLIIEGTNLEALEAACREYNGKPIINILKVDKEETQRAAEILSRYGASLMANSFFIE